MRQQTPCALRLTVAAAAAAAAAAASSGRAVAAGSRISVSTHAIVFLASRLDWVRRCKAHARAAAAVRPVCSCLVQGVGRIHIVRTELSR
ncbi:hypothetical protein JKP88DRAFT_222620 [Tribonema minus]|uniref:Secreted protein n=1 Tax=Tribonema minus TaxID=303371 RepID=A0A836CDA4_9STRA|nr:hypothetical protein JKP88DRAFT_222620 [Tribonema minus]